MNNRLVAWELANLLPTFALPIVVALAWLGDISRVWALVSLLLLMVVYSFQFYRAYRRLYPN